MLTRFLTEDATWRRMVAQSSNGYLDPVTQDVPIKVRWEDKVRLVRTPQGQEVVSMARVFTKAAVEPGDRLVYGGRELTVLAVATVKDLGGIERFREVAV